MYDELANRIAIMYHQDKELRIDGRNKYLSGSNYKLLIQGFESLIDIAYGEGKRVMSFNIPKMIEMTQFEANPNTSLLGEVERDAILKVVDKKNSANIINKIRNYFKNKRAI